jgi:UPF0755 protein
MPKRKRNTLKSVFLIIFLFSICILSLALLWGADQVLSEVRQKYGPADNDLNFIQKSNYVIRLYLEGDTLLLPGKMIVEEEVFEISFGETVGQISYRLQQENIIEDSDLFRLYLIYRGYDRKIQTGVFWLEPNMNAIEVAEKLLNNTPDKIQFNILAGWRSEEIAASLPRSGLSIDSSDFLKIVKNPPVQWLPGEFPIIVSLEGYLSPGEYVFNRDVDERTFIDTITNRFLSQLSEDVLNSLKIKQLSIQEAVILASLVERESIVKDEMPLIASVFLNRYLIGMKLDSDPTVQYALGFNQSQGTWWTNPLSLQDLQIDSPYNTYQNTGLPPSAICNPSLLAIQSIAYAADSPYYYFRARCDGSGYHNFAVTFEEHLENGCP